MENVRVSHTNIISANVSITCKLIRCIAVINQIRGLPLERGIASRKARCHFDEALPGILEDASAKLSGALRVLLAQLKLELDHLQMRINEVDVVLKKTAGENARLHSEDFTSSKLNCLSSLS
jgi:hypothetical protein